MNMFNVLTSASKVFAAFLGLGVMFLFFAIAIAVIFIVFTIVGNYKLFQKAGYNGWEAIVPFYNLWILVKIAGLKEYWFIGLVATYLANIIGRGGEFFTIAAIVASCWEMEDGLRWLPMRSHAVDVHRLCAGAD